MITRRHAAGHVPAIRKSPVLIGCSATLTLILASLAEAGKRTPPPCAADGVCLPNRENWGWYKTNWRPWPGEQVRPTPTPAEGPKEDETLGENLSEIQLPSPANEAQTDPDLLDQKKPKTQQEGEIAEPPAPLDGNLIRPSEPASEPENFPDDPFGGPALPKQFPTRRQLAQTTRIAPEVEAPASRQNVRRPDAMYPEIAPAAQWVDDQHDAEAPIAPPVGPSHVEPSVPTPPRRPDVDAPPMLPPHLLEVISQTKSPRTPGAASNSTRQSIPTVSNAPVQTPVTRDRHVTPVDAQISTSGIRLINPAAAIAVEPDDNGLQQAIYFEAADGPERQR